jgi:hypothetical protein
MYVHTYTGSIRGHVGFGGTGSGGCGAASAAIPHAWSASPGPANGTGYACTLSWLRFIECVRVCVRGYACMHRWM